jgi:DNA-binding CsgD family transcriptional regulator
MDQISEQHYSSEPDWRSLIAIGVIAEDLDARTIARYGGTHLSIAQAALSTAERTGLLNNGVISAADQAVLLAELDATTAAEVHAELARHLLSEGAANVSRAVAHAYSAGTMVPLEELVDIAEHCARTSLTISRYEDARLLLELAEQLDLNFDPSHRAKRLLRLSEAYLGLGQISTARELFARSFNTALVGGDVDTAVKAASAYAFPTDWQAGDRRASALLQQAAELELSDEQQALVDAARAVVEIRVPLPGQTEHQMAWVTRPTVAQPLANRSVAAAESMSDGVRCISLIAWRTTHRGSEFLGVRRERSLEALNLAQTIRSPLLQVQAASMLGVDALESGDRPLYDEALTVARWVADQDANPYLQWYVGTLQAGAALLDGDLERARNHRLSARQSGQAANAPGWFAGEALLYGQELLLSDEHDKMEEVLRSAEIASVNPIGKSVLASFELRLGRTDNVRRYVTEAIRQIEREASMLLVTSLIADVIINGALIDLAPDVVEVLTPWREHVAVDSNAWWCDGPISLRLAELQSLLGDTDAAIGLLADATPVAQALNDRRALDRIQRLRLHLGAATPSFAGSQQLDGGLEGHIDQTKARLTERERLVLQLMAEGLTNPQIAERLAYSLSTIRLDSMSIYRKLGVSGRVEAVALSSGT